MVDRTVEPVAEQFVDLEQQHEADYLGMWTFLATEVMMFGGVFMAVAAYRVEHYAGMHEGSQHLNMWLGGLSTAVLLGSSLVMALAVFSAREGRREDTMVNMLIAVGLGVVFLIIEGNEWAHALREGLAPGLTPAFPLHAEGAKLFFNLYFMATGLHGLHVTIGVVVIAVLTFRIWTFGLKLPRRHIVVEMVGLYWGLVDMVWIFLYPTFYLISR